MLPSTFPAGCPWVATGHLYSATTSQQSGKNHIIMLKKHVEAFRDTSVLCQSRRDALKIQAKVQTADPRSGLVRLGRMCPTGRTVLLAGS